MATPRIISGKAKGLRLYPVSGDSTRPITDRVKENLFNIIGQDILDVDFLDVFGGTGSVGLEAVSRGAAFCRFIEKNANAHATLKRNIEHTRLSKQTQLLYMDAFQHLKQTADRKFDIIYIAPPQYKKMWIDTLKVLDNNPTWFKPFTWLIVQIHPVEFEELPTFEHFTQFEQRTYGSTMLIFFETNE